MLPQDSRPSLRIPAAILLAVSAASLAATAHADVITVDDDGPADFPTIAEALSSSVSGDAILIRPGEYSSITIPDRSLVLFGEPGATVNGLVRVDGLAPGNRLLLRGLTLLGSNSPGLVLGDCGGDIFVEDCRVEGYLETSTPDEEDSFAGCRIFDCDAVVLSQCTMSGGASDVILVPAAQPGLDLIASSVAVYGGSYTGGMGGDAYGSSIPGDPGAPAIRVSGGTALVAGVTLRGGAGGSGRDCDCACIPSDGGKGGPGLRVSGAGVDVYTRANTFFLAPGGPGGIDLCGGIFHGADGDPGTPIDGPKTVLPGPMARMTSFGPSACGSVAVEVSGEAGEALLLQLGSEPSWLLDVQELGVQTVGAGAQLIPLGTVPASGVLSAVIDLPAPQGGSGAIYAQLRVATGTGSDSLGEPGATLAFGGGGASICAGAPNSTGLGASLDLVGSSSLAAKDFAMQAQSLPSNQTCILFYGGATAMAPLGDGMRCIDAPLFRVLPPQMSNAAGQVVLDVDLAQISSNPDFGPVGPGQTWYFQCWYRDPAGPLGTGLNLTETRSVVFCP